MKVSKHPLYFLSIKISQLIVCIIVLILETVSFSAWSNYVDDLNESRLYPQIQITKSMYFEKQTLQTDQSITYNGQVKIWYFIVIGVSLIVTGVANFDPWYSGPGLRCDIIRTEYTNPSIIKLAELAELQCNTLIASLSFGWINVGLHVVSLLFARKRASERNSRAPKRISLRPAHRPVFF
ncbi:19721_t:CDS:2 [Funneliformis geosporum]|uniref:13827_t:CDS:1 n=1 Tax=Funneliformis geosporum TaxID=1117311 RepID=A0A9W4SB80_9GLOM|nr:13827_t:CDS:2 [Funneliformis geosporum]CAI2162955.1 19721_t:CDS:2 [Funneliformis geosporum]